MACQSIYTCTSKASLKLALLAKAKSKPAVKQNAVLSIKGASVVNNLID